MHPDRDYYPTQLQTLWGAPNWGLKISNMWLSCVDKFQTKSGSSLSVWLWFKRDETLPNSTIKQSTQQRKAKPSHRGKKRTKREDPFEDMTGLVLKDVLLAGRIYLSSLLRWRYALRALFICSSSHSHHRHYACTLPLSKRVSTSVVGFFWFWKEPSVLVFVWGFHRRQNLFCSLKRTSACL